jgi:hypothetical protein
MYPEDGSSKLIQNVSNYLPFNTVSIPEKLSHLHQYCCQNLISQTLYSAMHGLWSVDRLKGLVDEPPSYDEVPRVGIWNFSVTRSTVLMEAERSRPNMMLSLHY